jgi:hypothetical protein
MDKLEAVRKKNYPGKTEEAICPDTSVIGLEEMDQGCCADIRARLCEMAAEPGSLTRLQSDKERFIQSLWQEMLPKSRLPFQDSRYVSIRA